MVEIDANMTFQTLKSSFASIVKFLVMDLARNIAHLEDSMLMLPQNQFENRDARSPYRDFRRVFRDLHIMTYNTVSDQRLRDEATKWFETSYRAETKHKHYFRGIELAELYIGDMYDIGILDLNIPTPCDFPFNKLLREYYEEQAKAQTEVTQHAIN